jgi:serum/glucocorticoid-regulated kinase 2
MAAALDEVADNNRAPTPTREPVDLPKHPRPTTRSGTLTIRVLWAENMSPPAGTPVPQAVQQALTSQQAKAAASVSPSSVTQSRQAKSRSAVKRDSVQRQQCWWLPYLVMEYEVNQVLITPLGGDLDKPLYMYQVHL